LTSVLTLPTANRTGSRDSGWVKLPALVLAKLQIAISVDAADRTDSSKEMTVRVSFSSDGVNADLPSYRITWRGNSKTFKSGWPGDGPALRIDNKIRGQSGLLDWLNGVFVRVETDTPVAVRYGVAADVLDGLSILDRR
jgi:hypothetical protein